MNIRWSITDWKDLDKEALYAIFALRIDVFVIEQNCPYQDADGKDLKSLHVCGYDENHELVAYARLVKPGVSYTEWSIGRVVTSSRVRRSGAGMELMNTCMQFFHQQDINEVRISAQSYLQEFYSRFGFVQVSEEYLEDNIPHMEMLFKKP